MSWPFRQPGHRLKILCGPQFTDGLPLNLDSLRDLKGLTLQEIARATGIAPRYLEAIEQEVFATSQGASTIPAIYVSMPARSASAKQHYLTAITVGRFRRPCRSLCLRKAAAQERVYAKPWSTCSPTWSQSPRPSISPN